MLKIIGLGPGAKGLITQDAIKFMKEAGEVILRTENHPSVAALNDFGIKYFTCDSFYESSASFEAVYEQIAGYIARKAETDNIVYAVPGSPMVAEKTVMLLRKLAKDRGIELEIYPSVSFLDELFARLGIDPLQQGLAVIDAADVGQLPATLNMPVVITQVFDKFVLSEVKLSLAELYGDEYRVLFTANLGLENEVIAESPVFELDRRFNPNHLTSIYVPARDYSEDKFDVTPLVEIMAQLRSENGCVWDNEQSHETLRRYLVEEVYEVLEAIEERDSDKLCEELGDLLLQIVFHSRIAEENGVFTVQDVINGICEKMVRRHPHVFGEVTVRDAAEVLLNWENIKKLEKPVRKKVLDGVPYGLPALMHAQKIQEKVSKVGMDWQNVEPVWDKLQEEISELKQELQVNNIKNIEQEFGDVLFTMVNIGRMLGIEAETALNAANLRFRARICYMEEKIYKNGNNWKNFSPEALDKLWEAAKIKVKKVLVP